MDVVGALKSSSKGRLKYDKYWPGNVKVMLQECTSPPSLSQGLKTPDTSIEEEKKDDEAELNTSKDRDEFDMNSLCQTLPHHGSSSLTSFSTGRGIQQKSPLTSPSNSQIVDAAIREYEMMWESNKQASVKSHRESFEKMWKGIQKRTEEMLMNVTIKKELEIKNQMEQVAMADHARTLERQRRQQKLREDHKHHAKMLDAKMKEAEAKRRQQEQQRLQEERQRQQELAQRLAAMAQIEQQVVAVKQDVQQAIEACPYKTVIQDSSRSAMDLINLIHSSINTIIQHVKKCGPSNEHVLKVSELLNKAKNAQGEMMKAIDHAVKKAEADKLLRKEQEDKEKAKQAAEAKAKAEAAKAEATALSAVAPGEILCVPEDAFQQYALLQTKLKETQAAYAQLSQDSNLKKYRFNLQKAVNTPVNAIAPTNGAHLRDKLKRLLLLLAGDTIEVTGKRISAKEHPAGISFVRDLFAKKIVKQSDEQVSSNYESAFAIAAVGVGVWASIPDIGDFILAYFHSMCPYIVPYYMPRVEGQSSEDYYKSLGYNYTDGQVEQQDKFLKRMSGIMRLYASILITELPPKIAPNGNPHGLSHAWMWLTRILNMEPRPDITATLLHDFLQVTGYYLNRSYSKQFHKLLSIFQTDFMPKIKAVTPSGAGGPLVRLENCLEKWIKERNIPQPEGVLSSNFWYTG